MTKSLYRRYLMNLRTFLQAAGAPQRQPKRQHSTSESLSAG